MQRARYIVPPVILNGRDGAALIPHGRPPLPGLASGGRWNWCNRWLTAKATA